MIKTNMMQDNGPMHHRDGQFPYVNTDISVAVKTLDSTLDLYGLALIEGAEGSGKNVLVNHYLEANPAVQEIYGSFSLFKDVENIDLFSNINERTIIIWDSIERFGSDLGPFEVPKRNEIRRRTTQQILKFSQNDLIDQIFLGRIGGLEQLEYSFPRLSNWLRNISPKITIRYDSEQIAAQMKKRGLIKTDDSSKLKFSGNFKSFKRALEARLPEDKKMSVLKGQAGAIFGELFYNNLELFKERPLGVTLFVDLNVPNIQSHTKQYWNKVKGLLEILNKSGVSVSHINNANPLGVKSNFITLGFSPMPWLEDEISHSTLLFCLSEMDYTYNPDLSVTDNLNLFLGE